MHWEGPTRLDTSGKHLVRKNWEIPDKHRWDKEEQRVGDGQWA